MEGIEVIREIDLLLPAIYRRLEQSSKLNSTRLSIAQEIILRVLATRERATMSELSRILGTSMGSTTVLVDRLLKEQMVTRTHSEEDRRVVFIQITEDGRRLLLEYQEYRVRYLASCLESLPATEVTEIRDALRKVANAMDFNAEHYQF